MYNSLSACPRAGDVEKGVATKPVTCYKSATTEEKQNNIIRLLVCSSRMLSLTALLFAVFSVSVAQSSCPQLRKAYVGIHAELAIAKAHEDQYVGVSKILWMTVNDKIAILMEFDL